MVLISCLISYADPLQALCDGVMSRRQIGKDAWKHVMWIPVTFTIGGGLLGWFD